MLPSEASVRRDRKRFAFFILLFALQLALPPTLLSQAPSEGRQAWVAVGYGGRRMVSYDMSSWRITEEWSQPGGDDSNNLMSLVFAKGKFVAVGGGGGGRSGGGHVLISTDGEKWREVWKAPNRINPIVFGNDRFLVGGPRKQIYWSKDAETWTKGAALTDRRCTHFRQGAFGNGTFVLTGNHGGNSAAWICTTKNGESVQNLTFDIPSIRGLAFGNGRFVVVGLGVRLSSQDGKQWRPTGLPEDERLTWVIYSGDEFLCGGGRQVYRSENGVDWTRDTRRFKGNPKWTDGVNMISTSWPGKMYFSPDAGKSWRAANELSANGINRVVRGAIKP